jgi:hypothetical protein
MTAHRAALASAALAACLLFTAGGAEADPAVKPLILEARVQQLEDEATIRRMLDDYMGLLASRDWDTYIRMFAKQGELDIVEGVLRGRDAIRTRMDLASKRMAGAATAQNRPQRQRADLLSDIRVQVTGDSATAKSRFTFVGEQADGTFSRDGLGRLFGQMDSRRRRVAHPETQREVGPTRGREHAAADEQ